MRSATIEQGERRRAPQLDRSSTDLVRPRRHERRKAHPGGSAHQVKLVHGPFVALPPFGRRASDIRRLRPLPLATKRLTDLLIAVPAIVICAPLMVIVAAVIKATSPGPVLFRQERVGRDGRMFEILKFRTMVVGAHGKVRETEAERARYEANDFKMAPDDPRITQVGRLLRRTSLDELPQLLNVLKGEMSIVGIRPLLAEELAMRPEVDQRLYCRLRPGLTGLWQVSGRSTVQHNQRTVVDRHYAADWRLVIDLLIILRTPVTLLRADQAG